MHIHTCELCGAVIPEDWDNKVHYGMCPECQRPTNYVIKENGRFDKKLVAEVNEKNEKHRLLIQYNVFEQKEHGGHRVNFMRLATLISKECYHFVTIEDDISKKQEVYYYDNGYYQTGGENRIREKVDYFIGDDSSIYARNEVTDSIKNMNHMKRYSFEPDTRYINVKNGIYDLETDTLLPHDPKFFFLNQIPVNYNKDKDCPKIKQFFKDVVYPEYYDLIQEMFGFVLYRKYFLHKAFLLLGGGRNGKGVTTKIIEHFVGYSNYSPRVLSALVEDRFAKADLYSKLVNLGAEMSGKALEDTSDFKHLTGGEPITGERKFLGAFSFVNYAKLIFNANQMPYQKYDKSMAYFNRWIIIPFPQTYDEDNPKTDPNILDKLISEDELSGLINWAIEGLKRLLKNKKFSYFENENEEETGERYELLAKPDKQFIKEHLKLSEGSNIQTNDVYEVYKKWASDHRYPIQTISSFSRSMKKYMMDKESHLGMEIATTSKDGKSSRCYKNVAWSNEPETTKVTKLDVEYPSDKVKRLKEVIDDNRKSGYKIDMDFLRHNFGDGDINHFLESHLLVLRGDGEYEIQN